MEYPDEETLVARGKYSTLNKERRAQIERVQTICKTIMHNANPLLKDCEDKPPNDLSALAALDTCVRTATSARKRIVELCIEMSELEPIAWPK